MANCHCRVFTTFQKALNFTSTCKIEKIVYMKNIYYVFIYPSKKPNKVN